METTEQTDPIVPDYPTPSLVLGEEAKYYLNITGRWATFLGIVGFISTALILLAAAFVGVMFSLIGRLNPAMDIPVTPGMPAASSIMTAASGFISIMYVLVAVFSFFLSYYLYRFGTGIKKGIMFNDPAEATKSLGYLKSHFKLVGITTIVIISLEILFFTAAILIGVFAASAMH